MVKMSTQEWRRFVLEKPRPAVAAVTRADGSSHATPVWIDLDDDQIVFTTWRDSIKGRALVRDPRIALVIQDETPPFSFVVISGVATISENLDELRIWAGRLGARYMGAHQADVFAARNGVPGELLIRVKPQRVRAERDVAV
jgi:PPOX class probable F420-dependent enzyme